MGQSAFSHLPTDFPASAVCGLGFACDDPRSPREPEGQSPISRDGHPAPHPARPNPLPARSPQAAHGMAALLLSPRSGSPLSPTPEPYRRAAEAAWGSGQAPRSRRAAPTAGAGECRRDSHLFRDQRVGKIAERFETGTQPILFGTAVASGATGAGRSPESGAILRKHKWSWRAGRFARSISAHDLGDAACPGVSLFRGLELGNVGHQLLFAGPPGEIEGGRKGGGRKGVRMICYGRLTEHRAHAYGCTHDGETHDAPMPAPGGQVWADRSGLR